MHSTSILGLVLLSTVKYALVVPILLISDLMPLTIFMILFTGGSLGYFGSYYFGRWLYQRIPMKYQMVRRTKRINKRSRWLVKLSRGENIWIIAFLTPVVLSIPVGALILSRFFDKKAHVSHSAMVCVLLLYSTIAALAQGVL